MFRRRMPVIEIRPATFRDALTLVLRRADREEVEALSGRDPRAVLVESVERSTYAWAGLADGNLVCLFGVCPMTLVGVTGVPWLLGSDAVCAYSRPFLRRNRAFVHAMLKEYPVLRNVVDARNAVSIRWLRWLGFTLGEPMPMGAPACPLSPSPWRPRVCDPVTIGIAGLALSAASTGVGFIGQMNQQAAMGAQQQYLANQARQRQAVADWQANDADSARARSRSRSNAPSRPSASALSRRRSPGRAPI
jgi:hypothetical protein